MSPNRRAPARAKRPTRRPVKRAAPRARRRAAPAQPSWSGNIHDLGLVSVNVRQWEEAKKFYGGTLGFPVAESMEELGSIQYGLPNRAQLAINRWNGPDPMPPTEGGGTPIFGCFDVRGTVEQLKAKGVRCDEPIEVPGVILYANIYDPDGNRLQLAQSIMPGP